ISRTVLLCCFCLRLYTHHRYLHSFPTRRSSDLQQEWEQPTEVQHKDIPEEKENENLNEEPSTIDDKQFVEIDNEYEDKEEKPPRSEEHTSELQSRFDLVCRLLLEKKKKK